MKKLVRNLKNMSVKSAVQCFFVTFGVCALALTGTFVFANHSSTVEIAGQGGFESPTIPLTEEIVDEISDNQNSLESEPVTFDDSLRIEFVLVI